MYNCIDSVLNYNYKQYECFVRNHTSNIRLVLGILNDLDSSQNFQFCKFCITYELKVPYAEKQQLLCAFSKLLKTYFDQSLECFMFLGHGIITNPNF